MNRFNPDRIQVKVAEGKASFQMILPMNDLMPDVAKAIEQTVSRAGKIEENHDSFAIRKGRWIMCKTCGCSAKKKQEKPAVCSKCGKKIAECTCKK
jgi:hypothetical protein